MSWLDKDLHEIEKLKKFLWLVYHILLEIVAEIGMQKIDRQPENAKFNVKNPFRKNYRKKEIHYIEEK